MFKIFVGLITDSYFHIKIIKQVLHDHLIQTNTAHQMLSELYINAQGQSKLLSGCVNGQRAYQDSLYQRYAPTMFGICLRYAHDFHHAEDLLQEGFIKVFKNIHRYRQEGSLEGWMKRIFINTAIEYLRRSKKENWRELEDIHPPQWEPAVFQHLAVEELLHLIQRLPSGYRLVFNLYAIEGYSHKEISKMLSIAEGTSKSQLSKARSALQRMVHEQL